eukprot:gene7432-gene8153
MLAKNLLPRPAPSEAPLTIPAISTNSIYKGNTLCEMLCYRVVLAAARTTVGTTFSDLLTTPSFSRRGSGTLTNPTLGSIARRG